ncbi:hypothetical protein J1N35_007918 [Gossypium stocksii]|uniref:Aluminum-activated malate transporter n=1 Tax=Gossypium stocksii TaxID=47602 RepID=A0A9D4AG08_9ROSI|nr:hypothetical protein J1N35_007918 [Gossypium stocksii]
MDIQFMEFCKEDSNRVTFSFKVGLAVLLLVQGPYEIFGTDVIWSILTVAMMFEYTVGSTFNRGFNRALGSLLAGILAIGVAQLALRTGRVVEPIISGEQLLKELVDNFNLLAAALEECVKKYLEDEGLDHQEFTKAMLLDEFPDEPAYRKCQAISHVEFIGQIQVLEYVKVGAVLRYCAYEVMAFHGVLHSKIQAPYNLRIMFREVNARGFSTNIVLPRMRALESTAALSLITFTSLLSKFVVRIDNLVEEDDELSKMTKFKA